MGARSSVDGRRSVRESFVRRVRRVKEKKNKKERREKKKGKGAKQSRCHETTPDRSFSRPFSLRPLLSRRASRERICI